MPEQKEERERTWCPSLTGLVQALILGYLSDRNSKAGLVSEKKDLF